MLARRCISSLRVFWPGQPKRSESSASSGLRVAAQLMQTKSESTLFQIWRALVIGALLGRGSFFKTSARVMSPKGKSLKVAAITLAVIRACWIFGRACSSETCGAGG